MIEAAPLPAIRRRRWELTRLLSMGFASLAALAFLGMLALFAVQSLPIWRHAGMDFLLGESWFFRAQRFGVLPMVYGTLAVSAVALLTAAPLGIGAALLTAEVLPRRGRLAIKTAIELLAGIPSVVYGLLGVLLLRNWMHRLLSPWEPLSGDTLLTGGVLLGVMVLPTIMTLADDALSGIPAAQRLAARALGLNRAETAFRISLRQALPGLASAVLLGLGRALGETIAVFLVIGRQDNQWPQRLLSLQPLTGAGQTLTTKLGGSETFLAYGDLLHWGAMMGLSLVLFGVVALVNLAGARLAMRRDGRA
ncbi:MAG TPA: phosphate ABC transporter permease subunit PstC [Thermoanaerobaculia bacterium]|jgi:phosphate transport system permease protein|nr:phosphate ABC transporter permease subunit PstC [Thermoanaerobaculia bacterium]